MTRAILKPVRGRWWRFESYQIQNGYIRPTPGAELEDYDPWNSYWRDHQTSKSKVIRPPYVSLLDLCKDIKAKSFSTFEEPITKLEPESEQALLAWCSEHGLLGILPHRTQSVVLAPRGLPIPGGTQVMRMEYHRLTTSWTSRLVTGELDDDGRPVDDEDDSVPVEFSRVTDADRQTFAKGTLLTAAEIPGQPHVIEMESLCSEVLSTRPLHLAAWPRFFPDVPRIQRATYPYPQPLSEAFWHMYQEPVRRFLDSARLLAEVIAACSKDRPLSLPAAGEQPRSSPEGRGPKPPKELYGLLAPVRHSLGYSGDSRVRLSITPSLIAAFAEMYIEDWITKRPLQCQECHRVFVSTSEAVRYCSPKCRNTATKRIYRKKRRERENTKGRSKR